MKKILFLVPAFVLLFSCTSEKSNSAGARFLTPKVVDKLLTETYIFNYDSAYKAMERVSKDQTTKGRQLFMQGLDQYINQKNAVAAIKLFRESVLYYPDLKTYNYLANAYIDIQDTLRADSSIMFDGMGDYETDYTYARLNALKKDTASAISFLGNAFAEGFSNKKRFENDKIFDYLRGQRGFVSLIVAYLKNDEKLRETLFRSFLATAPEIKLPFSLQRDSICYTGMETNSINYDFAAFVSGMEDSRFSRDVSNEYFMVGKIKFNQGHYAVVYKSVMIIADTLPPVDVKMAIFDSLGNLLDEKLFAQYQLPGTLLTGMVDTDNTIRIMEHTMKWKFDPLEEGYSENEYLGEDLVSENKFMISPEGRLTPAENKDKNAVVRK